MDATAIILAAGEGTRMKSNHCKVSHKILGKPMVQWIVDATIKAGCSRVVVVIGSHADEMRALIDGAYANSATKVECVEQTERLGTGHAVKVALEACGITQGPVVVLNGDLPLITADTVAKFAQTVATGELACTVMTMTPPDPFGYGRIKLGADGQIERIIVAQRRGMDKLNTRSLQSALDRTRNHPGITALAVNHQRARHSHVASFPPKLKPLMQFIR